MLDRNALRPFEKQRRHLLFAFGDHRRGEQRLLVVEVAVDRQLGDPSLGSDGVHAGTGITHAQEQGFRRLENGLALGQVLGTAGAGGDWRIVRHFFALILDW
ncbi:hypothetical protein D9M69_705450 [compost metagenome]